MAFSPAAARKSRAALAIRSATGSGSSFLSFEIVQYGRDGCWLGRRGMDPEMDLESSLTIFQLSLTDLLKSCGPK
jgi:hypothetical protein